MSTTNYVYTLIFRHLFWCLKIRVWFLADRRVWCDEIVETERAGEQTWRTRGWTETWRDDTNACIGWQEKAPLSLGHLYAIQAVATYSLRFHNIGLMMYKSIKPMFLALEDSSSWCEWLQLLHINLPVGYFLFVGANWTKTYTPSGISDHVINIVCLYRRQFC